MQVNNVQQSPNFGMALRIKSPKETAKALKELPMDVIKSYQKAGEELKDTKFYHVEVGPDLKPQLVSEKGAFWGPTVDRYCGRRITRLSRENDNLGVGNVYGVSRLYGGDVAEDGMVHHNVWTDCGAVTDGKNMFSMGSLADVAKTLDAAAIDYANKEAAKKAAEEAAKTRAALEVDELISKFGINA